MKICVYVYVCMYVCMYIHHSFISIQPKSPGWQEPEPSHVTGMALAHCILGKLMRVVCTSATTREILAAKGGNLGEKLSGNFA